MLVIVLLTKVNVIAGQIANVVAKKVANVIAKIALINSVV